MCLFSSVGAKSVIFSHSGLFFPIVNVFSVGPISVTHSLRTFASGIKFHKAKHMANKTVDMSKLKQVLRLYKNGRMSNRSIAEALELDKNTVNKYVNQAKKDSMSIDELPALDDPVLAHRMAGGNAAYTDSRFDELKSKLPYYAADLQRPHMTMQLLWEEYSRDVKHPYKITQFKEHLNRYIAGTGAKMASTILKDL